MKKSNFTILLLVLVVAIWGLVFIRVRTALIQKDNSKVNLTIPESKGKEQGLSQSHKLHEYTQDPFLGAILKKVPLKVMNNSALSSSTPFKIQDIQWPDIRYSGIVNNLIKGKSVGLVTINNRSQLVQLGQYVDSLKVIFLVKDSIVFQHGKQKKGFGRNM